MEQLKILFLKRVNFGKIQRQNKKFPMKIYV